jgi:hypothetical protein
MILCCRWKDILKLIFEKWVVKFGSGFDQLSRGYFQDFSQISCKENHPVLLKINQWLKNRLFYGDGYI